VSRGVFSKKLKKKVLKNWRKDPKAIDKFKFVHHFLPHPEKRERTKFLSSRAFIVYVCLILLLSGIFRTVPKYFPGILGYASNVDIRGLFASTNSKRLEASLPELRLSDKLSAAAKAKAEHMFAKNYWAHVSPDGEEPWEFILVEGYDYVFAGENLAKNFQTSGGVVNAWEESPTHKANLLSRNYDEVGFAVVNGVLDGYETTLVVQMFGKPREVSGIATKVEEERLLESLSNEANQHFPVQVKQEYTYRSVADVSVVVKATSVVFASFIVALLMLDMWYSKRKSIFKLTGKTMAHILLLLFAIVSIWFVFKPGIVL